MATLNESDHQNEIVRLEAEIDELAARIESCHKFILAGRIAVAAGSTVLIAMIVGGIQFNPSVMGIAAAAVLIGIVAAGSNHSTAKEAKNELTALGAKRATLIGQLPITAFETCGPVRPADTSLKIRSIGLRVNWRVPIKDGRVYPPRRKYNETDRVEKPMAPAH